MHLSSPIVRGQRRLEPEIMDQPGLAPGEHRQALAGIARINWLSRVLDLASGGGDVVIGLARRAAQRGLPIEFLGLDVSPLAVGVARERAAAAGLARKQSLRVEFSVADVLSDPLPANVDVVMSTLFLHHLTENAALGLLERMRDAAQQKLLVNDLRRSRPGYWLAQCACRLLSRSYVVRFDGPASVNAAFSLDEARRLAQQAGLVGARLKRFWPQRFLLAWSRG
jgi:SAM-dependent methyltransferase